MSYGQIFRCDPLLFLDRDESDYPLMLALMTVAVDRMKKEAADRG